MKRLLALLPLLAGCVFPISKQALQSSAEAPIDPAAKFVQEEDSGLSILGLLRLSEPDHYAVLLERARTRYRCASLRHAQLDFTLDHWLIVAFPTTRITVLCEPERRTGR